MAIEPDPAAALSGRFELRRQIGEGAFGTVWEAFDRQRGEVVALKTLHHLGPDALFHFKREFRSLSDLSHPNLAAIHELLSVGDHWFFTMEMLEGTDFREHLRRCALHAALADETFPSRLPAPSTPDPASFTRGSSGSGGAVRRDGHDEPQAPFRQFDRLRGLLLQLARGVSALHAAGKLHRDIKPSNVMVTPAERVVLLDFGLVADVFRGAADDSGEVVGTPAYMSPEQAAGRAVTPASDWYSVGVIAWESLAGRLPIDGTSREILARKQQEDPPSPAEFVDEIPDDLARLAGELVRFDPASRPDGREVLRRLGDGASPKRRATVVAAIPKPTPLFVGREAQMSVLSQAFDDCRRRGIPRVVSLLGESGMGKTALVKRFLDRAADPLRGGALVLASRCWERESVPFKAVDGLVDTLSHLFRRRPGTEVEAMLPRDVPALVRLFPVLKRVDAVAGAARRGAAPADPAEVRRRGFAAVREMVGRLSTRQPLVLWVDDLQWGDEDSMALLAELVAPPDPPAVLIILSGRGDDSLRERLDALFPAPGDGDLHVRLDLGELSLAESETLARFLAAREGIDDPAHSRALAAEARGNPYFLDQLARHAGGGERPASLGDLLRLRISRLPEDARRLLEAVAVAGRPIELGWASRAAGLESGVLAPFDRLRTERLVRGRGNRGHDLVEPYHDRIRAEVIDALDPERLRALHESLGELLEGSDRIDPETLADHFLAAGRFDKAAGWARSAGDRAAEMLAFERAARFYRVAFDLGGVASPRERLDLQILLAEALANAGRGAEAARIFLTAAKEASGARALDLRRRAAEQFLRSGHIDDGLDLLREVLGAFGMRLAATPRGALLSLLFQRARLAMTGLGWTARDPLEIPPAELLRIDCCWSVATGLALVDNIRAADFQARHLRLALASGESYRVARALACESGYSAVAGLSAARRTATVALAARRAAEASGDPHATGLVTLTEGLAAFLEGRWTDARRLGEEAERSLRDRCRGTAWELSTVHVYLLESMLFEGDLPGLRRRVAELSREARARGDRYAQACLDARFGALLRLVADDPAAAVADAQRSTDGWSVRGYHLQHFWRLTSLAETDVYAGRPAEAVRRLDAEWPALRQSMLLRIQQTRILALLPRGRALAAAAAASTDPRERRALADRAAADARRIGRERAPWAEGPSLLVAASALAAAGRNDDAVDRALRARRALDASGMRLYAWAAAHLLGRLRGEGALVDEAEAWFAQLGIVSPPRFASLLAPGGVSAPSRAA